MKKFLSSVLVAILLMVSLVTGVSFGSPAQGSADYIEGQLVVSLEEPFMDSSQSVDDILMEADSLTESGFTIADSLFGQDAGSFSVQSLDSDVRATAIEKMGLVYLVEYSVEDYKSIDSAKISLEKTLDNLGFNVRYVTENRKMYALETATVQDVSPQDIHNNQRWHYEMIKVPQAWEITTGSSSVRIGVLDTGIDSNHPSLKNLVNTSLGSSFVGGTTSDGNGHGTHVAGTIASYGSVSGVMQNATLIPIKVLNDSGSGSLYGVQQGIVYAANIRADVINMSLGGGGYDQGMDEAIQTAVGLGTIVVAAAGNDGLPKISYPAAYSSSIAVGSVTSSRTRSSFSNYGPGLDVMAPGSSIYSTYKNGQYTTLSGTSMSTPHVTGVLGLMRSVNPNLSPAAAGDILRNTAQPAGSSDQYGHGIVDAHAAVLAAGSGDDTQAPSAPDNLISTDITDTSVSLTWSASTGNAGITAYEVYNGSSLAATVTTTSATVTDLTANTTYTFTVRAIDAAGNQSAASNAVTVTTDSGSSQPSPTTHWDPGMSYKIGDEVTYGGATYQCLQEHISMAGWEPLNVPALWLEK
ncbi:S8 family serine peptidase [Paenibacillus thiaminolyticus]|uniref:Peptidase S8 n=1 Tax=Paenibacillus thiaminolyticus TaxID=49283 RepID=A0A3A3GZF4_PANTH|nr:S8 family serine peptidase [Paenibacillus thiaminolyticus]RJG21747.1 peptidase S8 [Paenibacillus thiaminolyticus]